MSLSVFVVNVVARENSLRNFRSIQKIFCAWPLSFSCHENFVLTEFEIYNSVLLLWNFTLKRFQNNLSLSYIKYNLQSQVIVVHIFNPSI